MDSCSAKLRGVSVMRTGLSRLWQTRTTSSMSVTLVYSVWFVSGPVMTKTIECYDCGAIVELDQAQIMRGKWLCNECFDDWMSYES